MRTQAIESVSLQRKLVCVFRYTYCNKSTGINRPDSHRLLFSITCLQLLLSGMFLLRQQRINCRGKIYSLGTKVAIFYYCTLFHASQTAGHT